MSCVLIINIYYAKNLIREERYIKYLFKSKIFMERQGGRQRLEN